jgi:hypothetical protein
VGKTGLFAHRITIVFKHGVQEIHLHTLRLLCQFRLAVQIRTVLGSLSCDCHFILKISIFCRVGKTGLFAHRITIVFKHGVQENHLHTLRLLCSLTFELRGAVRRPA